MEKNNDYEKILDIKLKSIEFNENELKDQMLSLDKKRDRVWIMLTLFSTFVFPIFIDLKKINYNVFFCSFYSVILLILIIFYFINIIVVLIYMYKYERVEDSPCLSKDQIFPDKSQNKEILKFKEEFKKLSYFKTFNIKLRYEISDDKIKRNNTKSVYINIAQKIILFHFFLCITIVFIGKMYVKY